MSFNYLYAYLLFHTTGVEGKQTLSTLRHAIMPHTHTLTRTTAWTQTLSLNARFYGLQALLSAKCCTELKVLSLQTLINIFKSCIHPHEVLLVFFVHLSSSDRALQPSHSIQSLELLSWSLAICKCVSLFLQAHPFWILQSYGRDVMQPISRLGPEVQRTQEEPREQINSSVFYIDHLPIISECIFKCVGWL